MTKAQAFLRLSSGGRNKGDGSFIRFRGREIDLPSPFVFFFIFFMITSPMRFAAFTLFAAPAAAILRRPLLALVAVLRAADLQTRPDARESLEIREARQSPDIPDLH